MRKHAGLKRKDELLKSFVQIDELHFALEKRSKHTAAPEETERRMQRNKAAA